MTISSTISVSDSTCVRSKTSCVTHPLRVRELSHDRLHEFSLSIPSADEIDTVQLFSDTFVAGAANPMGLAAELWREGDIACMRGHPR